MKKSRTPDDFIILKRPGLSAGIEYVLVNGTSVLKNGKAIVAVLPGNSCIEIFEKMNK